MIKRDFLDKIKFVKDDAKIRICFNDKEGNKITVEDIFVSIEPNTIELQDNSSY